MRLAGLGWSDHFANTAQRCARVASENRGHYLLWTEAGEITGRLAGNWDQEYPVTGDWVTADENGVIQEILPRRTKMSRKRAGKAWQEQVLAANVDVLFLVTGLDNDFNPRRLERYLLLAAESGARPVIVLNKADVCADPLDKVRVVDKLAPGTPVVLTCALEADGAGQLSRFVETAETAVLLGSSGAGKSTIANRLLNGEVQAVKEVRSADSRGRHTTTGRQLFLLDQGWLLIDTPGLRGLEPWAGPESAQAVFADIQQMGQKCRFRDCRHQGEPSCAVAEAIAAGELDGGRLESYAKLRREIERLEQMTNPAAALEQKRRLRRVHKAMRNFSKGDRVP